MQILSNRCSHSIAPVTLFYTSIAALVGSSAFSPAGKISRSSALKMSFEDEIGVLPPTGFWDPLGLSKDIDEATFTKYRTAELKHGRVAMLAVTGYIFQAATRLPGTIDLDGTTFDSVPNGIGAVGAISSLGWLQIVGSIGYWELIGWDQVEGSTAGDFNFGSKSGFINTPEKEVAYKTREIQNGRLAMLGIMALITHDIARPAGESLFTLHHF